MYAFFPSVRMTPILYARHYAEKYPDCEQRPHEYFIPLIFPVTPMNNEKIYLKDGIIHIVCIGKYRAYKNHKLLIRAISLLIPEERATLHIQIIGQDTTPKEHAYHKELEQLISSLSLNSIFSLEQNRPYDDMPQVYIDNDVLVLPSKLETAGMVILERMDYGLCTISSDNCGLANYITEANGGMTFDYTSDVALADVLKELIKDPTEIQKYGENGQRYVNEELSFEAYFSRFKQTIEIAFSYTLRESGVTISTNHSKTGQLLSSATLT